MLFNFQLFSFPDLITERSAAQMPAGRSPLSWYHLTDGWYWLDVGTTQLFRYTKTCFAQLTQPSGRAFHEPYVDYHIEAFWNDLTAILPAVFEPLPLALAQRLHSLSAWNDWMAAYAAWGEVCGTNDGDRDEEVEHYMDVLNWWSERRLDTSYLVAGPHIWFWSDGTHIHIGWDNRDRLFNGEPAWQATIGQIILPIPVFWEEIISFRRRLLLAMKARIAAAPEHWSPAEYAQEYLWLDKDLAAHTRYLEENLPACRTKQEPTAWQRILSALTAAEADPMFAKIRAGSRARDVKSASRHRLHNMVDS